MVYTIAITKRLQFFVHNGIFLRIQLKGLTWANAGWVTHRSHLQVMAVLHCTQTWLPGWENSYVIYPQGFKLRTRMVAASFLQMFLHHPRLSEQLISPPCSVCKTHTEIKQSSNTKQVNASQAQSLKLQPNAKDEYHKLKGVILFIPDCMSNLLKAKACLFPHPIVSQWKQQHNYCSLESQFCHHLPASKVTLIPWNKFHIIIIGED